MICYDPSTNLSDFIAANCTPDARCANANLSNDEKTALNCENASCYNNFLNSSEFKDAGCNTMKKCNDPKTIAKDLIILGCNTESRCSDPDYPLDEF